MISSEVESLARTGGLGDVVEALSLALAERGEDVLVVTPLYGTPEMRRPEAQTGTADAQVTRLSDPAELQRIARECLGMVMPGETAFMTVPKHGTLVPPKC